MLLYFVRILLNNLPRDNYTEFLELVIIFLGGIQPKGIQFCRPGAYLVCWMCKAIYCLKILIFQNQFLTTKTEMKGWKIICYFIIKCYVEFWFRSTNAIKTPYKDILLFLKKLKSYKEDNKQVAELAIKKFVNHLWYFTFTYKILFISKDQVLRQLTPEKTCI